MTQTSGSDLILQRMMTLHPKVIDLTLDRMHRLLAALGHPEQKIAPVIHVAGTNGKGSTQAMIRAGLVGAGHRVQAYTSPHLARFHERIRLSDGLISEERLMAVLDRCMEANGPESITFFEATTCAAFLAFSEDPADYVLLEVGLGGKLDATNVITPAVSVITPIDLDHQGFLGDTLTLIAGEKAGIIKRGVPVVVGPQKDESMAVIEATAARLGAPIFAYGQHWHVTTERGRLIYQDENGLLDLPMPALLGDHQVQNAGAAIATLRILGKDEAACEAAMTRVEWPARMQRLSGKLAQAAAPAELWLDGGHNPHAGRAIAATLAQHSDKPTYLICGMLNTKDVAGFMAPLAPLAKRLIALTIPGEANTLTAAETAAVAQSVGIPATSADSVEEAIAAIKAEDPNARILICGSLYLAGHILRLEA